MCVSSYLSGASARHCVGGAILAVVLVSPRPGSLEEVQDQPSAPLLVEVSGDEVVMRDQPSSRGARRGVIASGTVLTVKKVQTGSGCAGPWYEVQPSAWVCSRDVAPSEGSPSTQVLPIVSPGELTPWPYAFVREPTLEYRLRLGILQEERDLLPGFGFAVAGHVTIDGQRYVKSAEGTLVLASAVGITQRISIFTGVHLAPDPSGVTAIGWVNSRSAWVYDKPALTKAARVSTLPRYTVITPLEELTVRQRSFVRIGEAQWVDRRDVRIMRRTSRPEQVGVAERWIDVDIDEQILTAYEGDEPVFVTLISSGRRGPSATVKGQYRIWAKVAAIPMDNTDEELDIELDSDTAAVAQPEEEPHLYSLRHVPWTQFFFESYALHGVYWHDHFGNRRSHGCVNLSPQDARWLYEWTSPSLPAGFWSLHATDTDPGTLVRIR